MIPGTRRGWRTAFACVILIGLLTACGGAGLSAPQRIPTAIATHMSIVADRPEPTANPQVTDEGITPSPTPPDTPPPALVLPDASGSSIACETNTLRLALIHPDGSPVFAASAIAAYGDHLYLLADGGLHRLDRLAADSGASRLETLLSPDDRVGGRPIQELTDLSIDSDRGVLFLLDKAGHIFRYEILTDSSSVVYRSHVVEDEPLDKQLGAITVDDQGRPVVLDTADGALLTSGTSLISLEVINESRGLTQGNDLAYLPGRYFILLDDGAIRTVTNDVGSAVWRNRNNPRLGLALKVSDHLGLDLLYTVDGLRREIVLLLPDDAVEVSHVIFTNSGMGLLRDAVFAGERLYALADGFLYIYPGPDSGETVSCPPPPPPGFEAPPTLYGVDVLRVLQDITMPLDGEWELPPWPRVYPGASRLYRAGVHEGVDFYSYTGPSNFRQGWPILAALDGTVTRATIAYQALDRETYDAMVAESASAGETPRELLTRFSGRQVIIVHGNGVRSVYSHLDSIAPGIVTGAQVETGQLIGTVGVSGTEGEVKRGAAAPHLHFELWVGNNYLGYGMTIRETMWWYSQIFALSVAEP